MSKIKIFADSTCDLSEELILKYDITIIPLNIVLGMKSYQDGKEITPRDIYEWSDREGVTPKTAAPELGVAYDLIKPYMEKKCDIIFIGISEEMSVTCQVIRMVAQEQEYSRLFVVNSANLSTGIGLLILRAADLVKEGFTTEEIVERIEADREKIRASFVVDTLTYLHRGGRCNAVTALLGNTLRLKPMIVVKNGKMGVEKKYRGRQQVVVMNYANELKEQLRKADPKRVFITHSGIDKQIEEETYQFLMGLNYFQEILITRAGGVISSHCGPNTLGILFYEK